MTTNDITYFSHNNTYHESSSPAPLYDLQQVIQQYQSQPELLKLILTSKVEEDKRRAEEAKLRAKELDLYLKHPSAPPSSPPITPRLSISEEATSASKATKRKYCLINNKTSTSLSSSASNNNNKNKRKNSHHHRGAPYIIPLPTTTTTTTTTSLRTYHHSSSISSNSSISSLSAEEDMGEDDEEDKVSIHDHHHHQQRRHSAAAAMLAMGTGLVNDLQEAVVEEEKSMEKQSDSIKAESAYPSPIADQYSTDDQDECNNTNNKPRRRREMQAITKIVETREFPYVDNYFWKNNGNTVQKKTGCKSIYYKCSNSNKGCSVNKTVTAKPNGEYLIKYRGCHLSECGRVERIRDL